MYSKWTIHKAGLIMSGKLWHRGELVLFTAGSKLEARRWKKKKTSKNKMANRPRIVRNSDYTSRSFIAGLGESEQEKR